MTDLVFEIIQNIQIAESTFEMTLKTQNLPEIRAGQFANVKIPNRTDLILRRPFCIYSADAQNGTIKIGYALRGEGTKALSLLEAGQRVNVLLPLGNGFPEVQKDKKILLVGGGIGVLPLLSVAEKYGNRMDCCLGFKDKSLVMKTDDFARHCYNCIVSTDDGSYGEKGYVAQALARHIDAIKPDVIFACGPEVMLKSLKAFDKYPIFVSLEQRMGCGIGACLVCSCKTKKADGEHYSRVCADGPVFRFEEVFYE